MSHDADLFEPFWAAFTRELVAEAQKYPQATWTEQRLGAAHRIAKKLPGAELRALCAAFRLAPARRYQQRLPNGQILDTFDMASIFYWVEQTLDSPELVFWQHIADYLRTQAEPPTGRFLHMWYADLRRAGGYAAQHMNAETCLAACAQIRLGFDPELTEKIPSGRLTAKEAARVLAGAEKALNIREIEASNR